MAHTYRAEVKETIRQVQSPAGPPLWYNLLLHIHIWAQDLILLGGVPPAEAPATSGHSPWWISCRSVLPPPVQFSFLPCPGVQCSLPLHSRLALMKNVASSELSPPCWDNWKLMFVFGNCCLIALSLTIGSNLTSCIILDYWLAYYFRMSISYLHL